MKELELNQRELLLNQKESDLNKKEFDLKNQKPKTVQKIVIKLKVRMNRHKFLHITLMLKVKIVQLIQQNNPL